MECKRCKKEFKYLISEYGGYAVTENGNLCKECWTKYIEIKNQHSAEENKFWSDIGKIDV